MRIIKTIRNNDEQRGWKEGEEIHMIIFLWISIHDYSGI